ncbi:MAG TPA: ribosome maturation factor RimM [Actinomycetota bacterium]|nr:ribosome maturation factor RimM [Actinomycetota bacterium]
MTDELLAVGRIARAHGIRGEVAVQPLTEVQARFEPGSVLRLEDGRTVRVAASRGHGHRVLVKFDEVADRTEAEALRGAVLLVPQEAAPPIEDGDRFWVHQVVGLRVVTEAGDDLGPVRDVLSAPGNDVWVIDAEDGELLIPAVREVIVDVNLAAGTVTVRDLPGLREDPGTTEKDSRSSA